MGRVIAAMWSLVGHLHMGETGGCCLFFCRSESGVREILFRRFWLDRMERPSPPARVFQIRGLSHPGLMREAQRPAKRSSIRSQLFPVRAKSDDLQAALLHLRTGEGPERNIWSLLVASCRF